jgi:hypothetical protein
MKRYLFFAAITGVIGCSGSPANPSLDGKPPRADLPAVRDQSPTEGLVRERSVGDLPRADLTAADARHGDLAAVDRAIVDHATVDHATVDQSPVPDLPPGPEKDCLASGGTVSTSLCCQATPDFPNICAVGACGCAPQYSHHVKICACGGAKCFDGTACVPI